MSQVITIPQSMFKRLEKIAGRRSPQSIIKDAIKQRIEYEEYKHREIEAGLADIAAGRVYGIEEFEAKLAKARKVAKPEKMITRSAMMRELPVSLQQKIKSGDKDTREFVLDLMRLGRTGLFSPK